MADEQDHREDCQHGFPPGAHARLTSQLRQWPVGRETRVRCIFCGELLDLRSWCSPRH